MTEQELITRINELQVRCEVLEHQLGELKEMWRRLDGFFTSVRSRYMEVAGGEDTEAP